MRKQVCSNAKRAELNNWKAFNVIEEVVDVHQPKISTRWVVTEKLLNFNKVIKARLVVRGFEEEGDMQRDSPTAAKDQSRSNQKINQEAIQS